MLNKLACVAYNCKQTVETDAELLSAFQEVLRLTDWMDSDFFEEYYRVLKNLPFQSDRYPRLAQVCNEFEGTYQLMKNTSEQFWIQKRFQDRAAKWRRISKYVKF